MSGRALLDSNVMLYAFGRDDVEKGEVVRELLTVLQKEQRGVLSYQVLQEVLNVAFLKFKPPLTPTEASMYLGRLLAEFHIVPWSQDLLFRAIFVRERYRFQWYDCLIIAAALEARCEVFYTEDMQHGQRIEDLRVINPFR